MPNFRLVVLKSGSDSSFKSIYAGLGLGLGFHGLELGLGLETSGLGLVLELRIFDSKSFFKST